VFNTAWSRYNGVMPPCEPLELCWYPMAAAAELGWHSATERADYDAKFGRLFLGDASASLVLRQLDSGGLALEAAEFDLLRRTGGRELYRRHLLTARDLKRIQRDAAAVLEDVRGRFYQVSSGTMPAAEAKATRTRVSSLLERVATWRRETLPVLSEGLSALDAQEVIDTQSAGLERELRSWLSSIPE